MTQPIAKQLRDTWSSSGITLAELKDRASLDCSVDSLSRKLAGKQVMTTEESEAIAQALHHNIVWIPAAAEVA